MGRVYTVMNFPLKNIELHFPEADLLSAELLLDQGAVAALREVEKGLWTTVVDDSWEVEVQLSGKRIKAGTCECPSFRRKNHCEHLAATLLALRRELPPPAPHKKPAARSGSNGRLTVPMILDYVDAGELIDFVKQYARSNRHFSLALKARFTGDVPDGNPLEKYAQLLDTTINGARTKKDELSYRGTQQILQIAGELHGRVQQLLSEKDLFEAASLLRLLLEKVGPLSRKSGRLKADLDALLAKVFQSLELLLQQGPAPRLREELWSFCLEESGKFIYRGTYGAERYYELLVSLAAGRDQMERLRSHFEALADDRRMLAAERALLRIQLLEVLYRLELPEHEIQQYILEHLADHNFLLHVLRRERKLAHPERARFLAEKGLEQAPQEEGRRALVTVLFELALESRDAAGIRHYGRQLFLRTKDLQLLDLLRRQAPDWPVLAEELLAELRRQPFSIQVRDAVAKLLFEEDRAADLQAYIIQLQSLDLLQQYDRYLIQTGQEGVEDLYMQFLTQYIKNHLGRKPSKRIRETIEHLLSSGFEDLAGRLLETFRSGFPERHSLMEELGTIQSP